LQLRAVPTEMQLRVHRYLDEIWSLKQGVDEKEVLSQLPQYVLHDLLLSLNEQFLEKIPMIFGADTSALLKLNQQLTMTVATTGEFLCRFGELGRELHFVLSGEIYILGNPKVPLYVRRSQGRTDLTPGDTTLGDTSPTVCKK